MNKSMLRSRFTLMAVSATAVAAFAATPIAMAGEGKHHKHGDVAVAEGGDGGDGGIGVEGCVVAVACADEFSLVSEDRRGDNGNANGGDGGDAVAVND